MNTPAATFESHGQIWTKQESGILPCPSTAHVDVLLRNGVTGKNILAGMLVWNVLKELPGAIIGWRYASPAQEEVKVKESTKEELQEIYDANLPDLYARTMEYNETLHAENAEMRTAIKGLQ